MNTRLTIAVLSCLGLCGTLVLVSGQTTDEKRAAFQAEKRARGLEQKAKDTSGLPGDFHNFSKESDEELMQMLDTVKKDPDGLTGGRDNWRKFEEDLKTELDRRGRTPDGGWKKTYEDANANKVDINKKLNQQLREKQETKATEQPQGSGAAENPNGTQPVDKQNAPKNSAFEKAETVATERPPSSGTSAPEESAAKEAGKAEGSAARTGENAAGTTEREVQSAAAGKGAPKTQAELAESARQKLERGFQNHEPVVVGREEMKAYEAEEAAKRHAQTAVAGEERAAGAGKSAFHEVPAGQTEGLWGTVKRWGSGAIEALWGGLKVEATAQGSTRTIDHGEKKDTIQTALNTIDGEKKTLEQHLKEVGWAHNLGDVADPKKGFNTPEAIAEIDKIKEKVGPDEAAELEKTLARIQQLDQDTASIEKGRDALKDKWRGEGVSDIAASGGLGARTIDPNDLDSIPELKRYVPDLQKKESAPPPPGSDLIPQNPAEEKLLAVLGDKDKRKQFVDGRTNEEILNTFRATGSLKEVLKPKSPGAPDDGAAKTLDKAERSQSRTADKSPLDDSTKERPPPKSTDDVSKSELIKSSLFGSSEDFPPSEEPSRPELTKSPLFGSSDESEPTKEAKDFGISDGAKPPPEAGSLEDFPGEKGDQDSTAAVAALSGVALSGNAVNFVTSGFAHGQANKEAVASRPKVQGDYVEAQRLENELRKAEQRWKRAVAEAKRVAAQKRAAHELAIQQQQIAETQRRQYEAYQEMCARQRAYNNWLAQQQTAQPERRAVKRQRRQRQVQPQQGNAVHQEGGVIMDAPR